MKKTNKKGFTIVELVIVIAVIAVLAAVLIPTFSSLVKKANESKDIQLVRNLNTALAADVNEHPTMQSALDAAAAFGYDVDKINASATDNEILWDSVNDAFVYLKGTELVYVPGTELKNDNVDDWDFWQIADKMPSEQIYSIYASSKFATANVTGLTVGFDVGKTTDIESIEYTGNKDSVTIRTNSTSTSLIIDNAAANVNHYGFAGTVDVKQAASQSYHLFGTAQLVKVTSGRVVIEATANANAVFAVANTANIVIAEKAVVPPVYAAENVTPTVSGATAETAKLEDVEAAATVFAGGIGSAENPYLIETVEHLKNIATTYENGYKYFKVMDGVTEIDCSGWNRAVSLNGSFNGNGVKLVNLNDALFGKVGYQNTVQDIVIENFTAVVNSETALVHNLFNGGTTTFQNIKMHGYIEANACVGSFYRYGTCNFDDVGCNYTVNFVNCQSDVAIVDVSQNTPGALWGHAFPGNGNAVTINIDDKTAYTGTIYGTAAKANAYGAITNGTITVNGTQVDVGTKYENYKQYTAVKAEKDANGSYVIDKQSSVTSMKVSITAQISAYDSDGNKIANEAGITMVLDTNTLVDLLANTKVLDAFNSVELTAGSKEDKAEIVDGVLKIYIDNSAEKSYDGVIRLQVVQYDSNASIVSTGTIDLAVKTGVDGAWTVK